MLSAEQMRLYADKGFVHVAGVLSGREVSEIVDEWRRLWREVESVHPGIQLRGHETLGEIPDRIDPAYAHSPLLGRLCADPRLVGLAQAALGAPPILFKDKLISKLPGTAGYGLHQDWPYWRDYGVPAKRMVTLMIALDPTDASNGAIELWPGEARLLPPDPQDAHDVDPSAVDPGQAQLVAMDAGDVLMFHALVPHRSAPNRSQAHRRSYFPTYVDSAYRKAAERQAHAHLSPGTPR